MPYVLVDYVASTSEDSLRIGLVVPITAYYMRLLYTMTKAVLAL